MLSIKHRKLWLVAIICSLFAGTARGYPTGFVYIAAPYFYSVDASTWVYMDPQDTQSIADMNTGGWSTFGNGGTQNGWMYFNWPYAYSFNQNTWYYFDTTGTLWLYNYGTQAWELMNSVLPLIGTVTPARDLVGTWIGSGSYYDYTCYYDGNGQLQVIRNSLANAQFTFTIVLPGDGTTELDVWVHVLSYVQIAPDEYFVPPTDGGYGAPIIISGSRFTGDDSLDGSGETWSFNFTTNTMAGSITRDNPSNCGAIDSAGLNGIILTKQSN